jgi:hypothetical protein
MNLKWEFFIYFHAEKQKNVNLPRKKKILIKKI